jgi:hypothetical protein
MIFEVGNEEYFISFCNNSHRFRGKLHVTSIVMADFMEMLCREDKLTYLIMSKSLLYLLEFSPSDVSILTHNDNIFLKKVQFFEWSLL